MRTTQQGRDAVPRGAGILWVNADVRRDRLRRIQINRPGFLNQPRYNYVTLFCTNTTLRYRNITFLSGPPESMKQEHETQDGNK